MKNAAALAVVLVALAAAAVGAKGFWEGPGRTAGWTWDESVVASSSVSTLNISQPGDEFVVDSSSSSTLDTVQTPTEATAEAIEDGAWGSLVDTNITW